MKSETQKWNAAASTLLVVLGYLLANPVLQGHITDGSSITSTTYEKRALLYPNVWAGFSGDADKIDELKQILHQMVLVQTSLSSFWEIGETVSHIINGLYPRQSQGWVQVIIMGSINSKPIEMLSIVKDATHVYYPRLEANFVVSIGSGSGSPVAEQFITLNEGLDTTMSQDEGRDHAFEAVWWAVQYDWFSGGMIRETIVDDSCPRPSGHIVGMGSGS